MEAVTLRVLECRALEARAIYHGRAPVLLLIREPDPPAVRWAERLLAEDERAVRVWRGE